MDSMTFISCSLRKKYKKKYKLGSSFACKEILLCKVNSSALCEMFF